MRTTTRPSEDRLFFLKKSGDIERVKKTGRRLPTPLFNLVSCRSDLSHARVGVIVGKRLGGAVVRNRAKRQDRTRLHLGQLRGKKPVAATNLGRLGLVLRRQAFDGIGHAASGQPEAVARIIGPIMAGKAELVQRAVEQDAGVIAGKRPAGPVRAVHPRGEPHHQQVGAGIAERRHGAGVIVRMFTTHLGQKPCQSRTGDAMDVETAGQG